MNCRVRITGANHVRIKHRVRVASGKHVLPIHGELNHTVETPYRDPIRPTCEILIVPQSVPHRILSISDPLHPLFPPFAAGPWC